MTETEIAPDADAVLDAALVLADEFGWANVTARAVGERLGGGPELVMAHYADLDALADAWFRRALRAAIGDAPGGERVFAERLAHVFGRWLAALAPHRETSLAMIRGKIYPAHPHHWVPLIFNLSRLVQWMLDAAGCEATGRRRQATEIAVSALVPLALRRWRSGDDAATERFVAERLAAMECRLDRIWPVRGLR